MIIERYFKDDGSRALVFSFDEKYVKYFSCLLLSFAEHFDRSARYELIVLHDSLCAESVRLLKSMAPSQVPLRFFNVGECAAACFGDLASRLSSAQWDIATFYDLLVPLIMPDYERALYCDSDMIFCADPGKLFEMPFDGNELTAVMDSLMISARTDHENSFIKKQIAFLENGLGIKRYDEYFNGGVLMFNIPAIDKDEYLKKVRQALELPFLPTVDQDVLNFVFRGRTGLAPERYNLAAGVKEILAKAPPTPEAERYGREFESPVIIHYASYKKPWLYPDTAFAGLFWRYAKRSPLFGKIIKENMDRIRTEEKAAIVRLPLNRILAKISKGDRRRRARRACRAGRRLLKLWLISRGAK